MTTEQKENQKILKSLNGDTFFNLKNLYYFSVIILGLVWVFGGTYWN